jgi:hypothetical protein
VTHASGIKAAMEIGTRAEAGRVTGDTRVGTGSQSPMVDEIRQWAGSVVHPCSYTPGRSTGAEEHESGLAACRAGQGQPIKRPGCTFICDSDHPLSQVAIEAIRQSWHGQTTKAHELQGPGTRQQPVDGEHSMRHEAGKGGPEGETPTGEVERANTEACVSFLLAPTHPEART